MIISLQYCEEFSLFHRYSYAEYSRIDSVRMPVIWQRRSESDRQGTPHRLIKPCNYRTIEWTLTSNTAVFILRLYLRWRLNSDVSRSDPNRRINDLFIQINIVYIKWLYLCTYLWLCILQSQQGKLCFPILSGTRKCLMTDMSVTNNLRGLVDKIGGYKSMEWQSIFYMLS